MKNIIIDEKIIISLTTIPSRLEHIIPVIDSIKNQTILPDEIVLVLPLTSFREQKEINKDPYIISERIHNYIIDNNITLLRPEKDYGPIMKLLSVLLREKENNSNNIIISIDDDKIYFNNTLEDLLNGYKRNNCVCARKGSILNFYLNKNSENNINNINAREQVLRSADLIEDKQINFIFGTGGVLYNPSFFNDNIMEEICKLPNEAFYVDDAVISIFLMKNNIKMILVKSIKNDFQKKYDHGRYGIMDRSTISQNINRLAVLNYKNNNNIVVVNYFKKNICEYIEHYKLFI
jgi:hypothetical protein